MWNIFSKGYSIPFLDISKYKDLLDSLKKKKRHACNPNTGEAEAGESVNLISSTESSRPT